MSACVERRGGGEHIISINNVQYWCYVEIEDFTSLRVEIWCRCDLLRSW